MLDVFYIDSKTAICYTIRTFIPMTFAVIKTGGKQYLVEEGQTLIVERLEHDGIIGTADGSKPRAVVK